MAFINRISDINNKLDINIENQNISNTKLNNIDDNIETIRELNVVSNNYLNQITSSIDILGNTLDTIHGDLELTNAKLDNVISDLDIIHMDLDSSNIKLDTLHTDLETIHIDLESSNLRLDILHTDLDTTIHGDIITTNTKLDTLHTDLDTTIHNDLSTTIIKLNTLHEDILTTNAKLDILHTDVDGLTFDGSSNLNVNVASGSITISSVNIKDSAGNNLTSTSNALNNYITNGSTTNTTITGYTSGNVGLSTYQILPKVKSFAMIGANGNSTAAIDTLLGGSLTTLTTATNFGLANPRIYYLSVPTGYTVPRTIKYAYIDSSGNEQSSTQVISVVNTYYSLPSAISVNQFSLSGGNANIGASDYVMLSTTNTLPSVTNTSLVGSISATRNQYNGVFTCPNNAIAMITQIDAFCGTAFDYVYMNIWDASGNRSMVGQYIIYNNTIPNMRASGGGDYSCLGRIITAGESVAFSTSSTTSVFKVINFNIVVRYF